MTLDFLLSEEELERLSATRREIHRFPELGFQEVRTSNLVFERLSQLGLEPERVVETGVIALLDSGVPGPTVMLRADMDALPLQEENEHGYRSQNDGCMHACGHDGHTSILLMVAEKLVAVRSQVKGRILLVFQPAEEGEGGAQAMIDSGLLERFTPKCAAGLHLWSESPTGEVHICDGPFMASTDLFEVTVQGQGGHGAVPHSARDPVVAAAQMILGLQTIVSRRVDPEDSAVLTVGMIQGGDAFNIIPDQVRFAGTVRTFSKDVQAELRTSMASILEGIAKGAGMSVDLRYEERTMPTVNDPFWCAELREVAREVEGVRFGRPGFRTMAGEDMGYFLDKVPGVFFFVGAGNPEVGAQYPHHHPRFEIDEEALGLGVELLFRFATKVTGSDV